MQKLNWNDLRYVLAISRTHSLADAARFLNVDNTTVTRRIAALQNALDKHICQRTPDGHLGLTNDGVELAIIAERMELDIHGFGSGSPDVDGQISGTVRLTSVPLVINRLLAPMTGRLLTLHPKLNIELIANPRDFSLTRREADMALRMAQPKTGGMRIKTRRVGTLRFAPYVGANHTGQDLSALPWVQYDDQMSYLPQAQRMTALAKTDRSAPSQLSVSDIETAIEAVAGGHGKSIFPHIIAERDNRLAFYPMHEGAPVLDRELWLLVHSDLRELPRIKAVVDWIDTAFNEPQEKD